MNSNINQIFKNNSIEWQPNCYYEKGETILLKQFNGTYGIYKCVVKGCSGTTYPHEGYYAGDDEIILSNDLTLQDGGAVWKKIDSGSLNTNMLSFRQPNSHIATKICCLNSNVLLQPLYNRNGLDFKTGNLTNEELLQCIAELITEESNSTQSVQDGDYLWNYAILNNSMVFPVSNLGGLKKTLKCKLTQDSYPLLPDDVAFHYRSQTISEEEYNSFVSYKDLKQIPVQQAIKAKTNNYYLHYGQPSQKITIQTDETTTIKDFEQTIQSILGTKDFEIMPYLHKGGYCSSDDFYFKNKRGYSYNGNCYISLFIYVLKKPIFWGFSEYPDKFGYSYTLFREMEIPDHLKFFIQKDSVYFNGRCNPKMIKMSTSKEYVYKFFELYSKIFSSADGEEYNVSLKEVFNRDNYPKRSITINSVEPTIKSIEDVDGFSQECTDVVATKSRTSLNTEQIDFWNKDTYSKVHRRSNVILYTSDDKSTGFLLPSSLFTPINYEIQATNINGIAVNFANMGKYFLTNNGLTLNNQTEKIEKLYIKAGNFSNKNNSHIWFQSGLSTIEEIVQSDVDEYNNYFIPFVGNTQLTELNFTGKYFSQINTNWFSWAGTNIEKITTYDSLRTTLKRPFDIYTAENTYILVENVGIDDIKTAEIVYTQYKNSKFQYGILSDIFDIIYDGTQTKTITFDFGLDFDRINRTINISSGQILLKVKSDKEIVTSLYINNRSAKYRFLTIKCVIDLKDVALYKEESNDSYHHYWYAIEMDETYSKFLNGTKNCKLVVKADGKTSWDSFTFNAFTSDVDGNISADKYFKIYSNTEFSNKNINGGNPIDLGDKKYYIYGMYGSERAKFTKIQLVILDSSNNITKTIYEDFSDHFIYLAESERDKYKLHLWN